MSTYVIEIIRKSTKSMHSLMLHAMHAGIQCEELPPVGNGSISYHIGTSFLGTIAMYKCEDGFFLDGDDERNCITGEAGSRTVWTGQEPQCVCKLRKKLMCRLH